MKTYKHDLFPVPLNFYESFLPSDLTKSIYHFLLSKDDLLKNHKSVDGGGSSFTPHSSILDEISNKIEGGPELVSNLNVLIEDFARGVGFSGVKIANSWFNIMHKGSVLNQHMHCGSQGVSIISGALYINSNTETSPIQFNNPNPYIYLFNPKTPDVTHYNFARQTFNPQTGDLILFPSWLLHSVPQPCAMDNRMVISFNTTY